MVYIIEYRFYSLSEIPPHNIMLVTIHIIAVATASQILHIHCKKTRIQRFIVFYKYIYFIFSYCDWEFDFYT